ncbi:MAG: hypothetical protein BVN35_00375 [Proteobacteria bacterium ST_bin11]|jgi:hypothetical protein|nr:MAG: hypothetical protein BVN35_00375 [Proteobacteria bacterium ST_bin11]
MSTGNIKKHVAFFVAYVASFFILLIIFLAAMYTQDRFLDVEYLKYTVVRMIGVSLIPGILGAIFARSSYVVIGLFGLLSGPLISYFLIVTFAS